MYISLHLSITDTVAHQAVMFLSIFHADEAENPKCLVIPVRILNAEGWIFIFFDFYIDSVTTSSYAHTS